MSKIFKKALAVMLVAVMMLTAAPLSGFVGLDLLDWLYFKVSAATEYTSGKFKYCINGDGETVTITGCTIDPQKDLVGVLTIPSTINGKSVECIGSRAFYGYTEITKLSLPEGIKSIDWYAFLGCSKLTEVYFPESLERIGFSAFKNCKSLRSINYPIGVKDAGDSIFAGCEKLTEITVPESVTEIPAFLFHGASYLQEIQLPSTLERINASAFYGCSSLKSIDLPKTLKSIEYNAFFGCTQLTEVYFPESLERIGFSAFKNCKSLRSINYPIGVKDAGDSVFAGCEKLTEITVPESVTEIPAYLFYGASFLQSVKLPYSLMQIGMMSFEKCDSLTDVYYAGSEEDWNNISIGSNNDNLLNATIHFNSNGGTSGAYNLGEETYGFENFGDRDSIKGHCFGMSITSSGYYLGVLDIKYIGINNSYNLYQASCNTAVKRPICYYQNKQGSYARKAIVAGGTWYKNNSFWNYVWQSIFNTDPNDVEKDWEEVVSYVKTHKYDDTGALQVAIRKGGGGHAVNFLRYENIDGQDRIYVYDNNCPNLETYFCKGSDGKIYQKPYSTFKGAIDCIALRDVKKYLSLVDKFKASRVFYARANVVEVVDAYAYPMEQGDSTEAYIMYEVPEGVNEIKIIPLVENATFTYMEEEYDFGEVDASTCGILKLASTENENSNDSEFSIINEPSEIHTVSIDNISMNYKSSTTLVPSIDADAGVNYTVSYESSDISVVAVDQDGKLIATGTGSAEITVTVTDKNGNTVSDTCEVTVEYSWLQWIIVIVLFGWIWY